MFFGWPQGGIWSNIIASVIWTGAAYLVLHFAILRHYQCVYCWRPGRVPVVGTPHHVCRKHAEKHGHVHE